MFGPMVGVPQLGLQQSGWCGGRLVWWKVCVVAGWCGGRFKWLNFGVVAGCCRGRSHRSTQKVLILLVGSHLRLFLILIMLPLC